MQTARFTTDVPEGQDRIKTQVLLTTPSSKEIQITLPAGSVMKKHQAPSPIIVHLLSGAVEFGLAREVHSLVAGDILSLPAQVPHDVTAQSNSVIRLSLSLTDTAARVSSVISDK